MKNRKYDSNGRLSTIGYFFFISFCTTGVCTPAPSFAAKRNDFSEAETVPVLQLVRKDISLSNNLFCVYLTTDFMIYFRDFILETAIQTTFNGLFCKVITL